MVAGGFVPSACRNTSFDGLMAHVDLTATMLAVAGVNLGSIRPRVDGVNHWPAFTSACAAGGVLLCASSLSSGVGSGGMITG